MRKISPPLNLTIDIAQLRCITKPIKVSQLNEEKGETFPCCCFKGDNLTMHKFNCFIEMKKKWEI